MTRSGVLLVDKPEGPSSAQVVGRVKRWVGARKVGHLGTLDPFASGLLLVGVNEATKIADIFLAGTKRYQGIIFLGTATDTQDSTGRVLEERPVPAISEARLRALQDEFTGQLLQVPPMFSALKKDGVRLYRLARQGKEVPREPRTITVSALRLRPCGERELAFEAACSRGTYVRTLAADMGRSLGCGAHLKSLRRVACGPLTVDRALTLEELEKRCAEGSPPLLPLAAALAHLRAVEWPSRLLSRLRLGQQELLGQLEPARNGERLLRLLDQRGQLAALAEWLDGAPRGRWRLLRVFQE